MGEKINGSIGKILFYNPDNGYTVALFEMDYRDKNVAMKKAKLMSSTLTIVGCFDRQPYEDEEYIVDGDYIKDKNYGLQFRFTAFERKNIQNEFGVISYLSSDLFPGIGMKIAKMIVEKLGIEAIEKIKVHPECLLEIGLSHNQQTIIYDGIMSDQNNQTAVLFFLNHGITMDMAHKIITTFGEDVLDQVKENPYILMEKLERFGFKKNDQFAMKLGIAKNSTVRLKAVLCFILQETIYQSGNSYISKHLLYDRVMHFLEEAIDKELFTTILQLLQAEKRIYMDEREAIFDYKLYIQEVELAQELVKLLKGNRNPLQPLASYCEEQIENEYQRIEQESTRIFSEQQKVAIRAAFTEPLVIITGGPGTGKTTIVHAIIQMYLHLNQDNSTLAEAIALLAPTGRAAKRLKETTSLPAMTIHRYLGYTGQNHFAYNKYNRTNARLIIVDEASMMDLPLAHRLVTSMHEDARLIIVGDVDQLPSVGPGQILKDLIDTKEIKTIRLDKIHRQAEGSSIIQLAHSINEGVIPDNILEKLPDRNFISTDNLYLVQLLVDLVMKSIERGKDIKKQLQILIPMYKGECGINEINQRIQALINPFQEDIGELKHMGRSFRTDDKVIQLVNRADKGIMNGDVGFIQNMLYKEYKPIGISVLFDIGLVDYTYEELEDLNLAYAISVHKAQGSEFDLVIMPISTKHYIMLKRKLIYTAITRAKQTLLLIGDIKALQLGVTQIEVNRRTILKQQIIDQLAGKIEHNGALFNEEVFIDDKESAFGSIGERDFGKLKPSDFE